MPLKNDEQHYGSVAKFFHWLIFVLMVGLFVIGFVMGELNGKPYQAAIYNVHKLIGLSVLLLALLRLMWALTGVKPLLPGKPKWWEIYAERFVHYLLYFLLFTMPLSGWIMSTAAGRTPHIFGINFAFPQMPFDKEVASFFANIHIVLAWTLLGTIAVHIFAAIKHHVIDKDNVLIRMLPRKNK